MNDAYAFKLLLESYGADLGRSSDELSQYMAERTLVLVTLAGLPGYKKAVIAERDNVALFMGIEAMNLSSAGRARILSFIQGALVLAAS